MFRVAITIGYLNEHSHGWIDRNSEKIPAPEILSDMGKMIPSFHALDEVVAVALQPSNRALDGSHFLRSF